MLQGTVRLNCTVYSYVVYSLQSTARKAVDSLLSCRIYHNSKKFSALSVPQINGTSSLKQLKRGKDFGRIVAFVFLSQKLKMGDSNWKRLLKSQHADLEKLEAMDAELNDAKIAADIENALRKTKINSSHSYTSSTRRSQHVQNGG